MHQATVYAMGVVIGFVGGFITGNYHGFNRAVKRFNHRFIGRSD